MSDGWKLPGTSSDVWMELSELLGGISRPDRNALPSAWTRIQKVALVAVYLYDTLWPNIASAIDCGAPFAGLSLSLAVVDYLGGFLKPDARYKERYVTFIEQYIPIHSRRSPDIYHHLRSAFLHNLVLTTPTGPEHPRFVLTARPSAITGTSRYGKGVHFFSISNFAQEVIDGAARYLIDVANASDDSDLVENFIQRFDLKDGNAVVIFNHAQDFGGGRASNARYSSDYVYPFFKMLRAARKDRS